MQGTHTKIHLAILSQQQITPTLYNFAEQICTFLSFASSFCTTVQYTGCLFCAPATKLNIPVSEHFGKLHAPIGIATVQIR